MNSIGKTFRSVIVGAIALSASVSTAWAEGSIVSFNGPAGEAYIGKFIKGIKATAELKGFDIKVFENQFNQAEQDQQVQQVLSRRSVARCIYLVAIRCSSWFGLSESFS